MSGRRCISVIYSCCIYCGAHSGVNPVVHIQQCLGPPWQQPTIAKKHDALDPSEGRVTNMNDGDVTMQLLAMAWRQMRLAVAQIRQKRAVPQQL